MLYLIAGESRHQGHYFFGGHRQGQRATGRNVWRVQFVPPSRWMRTPNGSQDADAQDEYSVLGIFHFKGTDHVIGNCFKKSPISFVGLCRRISRCIRADFASGYCQRSTESISGRHEVIANRL
jgi:hypothetical protein